MPERKKTAFWRGRENTRIIFSLVLVVLLSFFCFLPVIHNDLLLTWDDGGTIVYNQHIKSLSPGNIWWAFTTYFARDWLPLTWISFALDYFFWGLNPARFHLTNVIIHALNAGMFFLLSLELLKRYMSAGSREGEKPALTPDGVVYCSLLAALIFALHPLRVESVAWAMERKGLLSVFFGIPAVLAYLKYTGTGPRPVYPERKFHLEASDFYLLAVVFYCLSLLSKPTLLTLPLILFVLDWFPLRRLDSQNIKKALLDKIPFLLCAGVVFLIVVNAHQGGLMPLSESGVGSRALNAVRSIMQYMRMTVWPARLSPFYLHPGTIDGLTPEYIIPVLFFVAITGSCLFLAKRRPVFITLWFIYLITLLPVLGFIQVSTVAMADRYSYLPGLELSLLIAFAITALLSRPAGRRPVVVLAALLIVLPVLSAEWYLTSRQIPFWKDDVTLCTRAIDVQPHFSGSTYFHRAMGYELKDQFRKALADINEALAIAERKKYTPGIYADYFERARVLDKLGDLKGAIADCSRAGYHENVCMEIVKTGLSNSDFGSGAMYHSRK